MRPHRDFQRMRSTDHNYPFSKILEDFFAIGQRLNRSDVDAWIPPTDVFETAQNIIIKMSLPGVNTSDIDAELKGNVITVRGCRDAKEDAELKCYHQMEIRNGRFERRIALRQPFDPDKVSASYKDGFLRITVPKAQEQNHGTVSVKLWF